MRTDVMDDSPFFIVGCGRSGTTLLRIMLNRHTRIAIPTESLFMIDYLRVHKEFELSSLISLLVDEPEIREWGIKVSTADFKSCASLDDVLRQLLSIYTRSKGKDIWGQKTPRFVRHLDLLGSAFPEAKFIHVVRDPRAVVNSLIHSDVHHSNPYHGSKRWSIDVAAGSLFERQFPSRVLRVHYEELMRDTSRVLQTITEFLGFNFESGMMDEYAGTEEYSTFYDNIHQNIDKGITTAHIDKWKHQLEQQEIQAIESMLFEQMQDLGYELTTQPAPISRRYRIRMQVVRFLGLLKQILKYSQQRSGYLPYLLRRKIKLGLIREFLWTVNY